MPLVAHVQIFGSGLTPLITWNLPDLTGMSVDRIRIRVHDATTGDALAQFTACVEDVDGDGVPDLVLHFSTQDLVISADDTEAVLQGSTVDGRLFRGVDSVRIVH